MINCRFVLSMSLSFNKKQPYKNFPKMSEQFKDNKIFDQKKSKCYRITKLFTNFTKSILIHIFRKILFFNIKQT